jgi:hypothetical protein
VLEDVAFSLKSWGAVKAFAVGGSASWLAGR